jgi:hypothetical protein
MDQALPVDISLPSNPDRKSGRHVDSLLNLRGRFNPEWNGRYHIGLKVGQQD